MTLGEFSKTRLDRVSTPDVFYKLMSYYASLGIKWRIPRDSANVWDDRTINYAIFRAKDGGSLSYQTYGIINSPDVEELSMCDFIEKEEPINTDKQYVMINTIKGTYQCNTETSSLVFTEQEAIMHLKKFPDRVENLDIYTLGSPMIMKVTYELVEANEQ